MKMKAVSSFETSVTIYQPAWRKIAENLNIYKHRSSNLKCQVSEPSKVCYLCLTDRPRLITTTKLKVASQ